MRGDKVVSSVLHREDGFEATFDYADGDLYVKVSDESVARTVQFHNVNIDLDADGNVVGVEVL